ncbi:MAG: DUF1573 domain-containing protein [Bacillota bacterium]|nr:DUF1573 domain-containing protein [Bacillota bacterium]
MQEINYEKFQETVNECLIRHKSILDVLSKFQEASARVNRAFAKAVTSCGCVRINASRQSCPSGVDSYSELRNFMHSHLEGELCDNCREILETELGQTLFYLAAFCNLCHLSLDEIVQKEYARVLTLGQYILS